MTINKILIYFGILCILLGTYLLWQRNNPKRLTFFSFSPKKIQSLSAKKNQPDRLIIKSLNIDLPIIPAKIKDQKLETTTQGVSWLTASSIPGEKGNSILFGHNWSNLLGNLARAKPGQNIEIILKDKKIKSFIIDRIALVSPKDVSLLQPTDDVRITLYTCAGFFDQNRLVAVATFKDL